MFYALSWFAVLGLLALWSLAAWALHWAAAWTVANAGAMAGSSASIEGLRVPAWLAPWIPPELAQALTSWLAALAPVIRAVLDWAPALADGLSVAIWVLWAIGSAILLGLGLLLSGTIAVLRRRSVVSTG